MIDSDKDATEALLALGSATTVSKPIAVDLTIDKENLHERDYVIVLNHTKKDPEVECVYCAHHYCGGVPRIRAHLAKLRGQGIIPCHKVPPQVSQAFRDKANSITDQAKKSQDQKDARANLASQSKDILHCCLILFNFIF